MRTLNQSPITSHQSNSTEKRGRLSPHRSSNLPDGVSSVGQLSSDAVIQAVVSMIAAIGGSHPSPAEAVALSMRGAHPAERFNACRLVASRVRVSRVIYLDSS